MVRASVPLEDSILTTRQLVPVEGKGVSVFNPKFHYFYIVLQCKANVLHRLSMKAFSGIRRAPSDGIHRRTNAFRRPEGS